MPINLLLVPLLWSIHFEIIVSMSQRVISFRWVVPMTNTVVETTNNRYSAREFSNSMIGCEGRYIYADTVTNVGLVLERGLRSEGVCFMSYKYKLNMELRFDKILYLQAIFCHFCQCWPHQIIHEASQRNQKEVFCLTWCGISHQLDCVEGIY